jgi:2,3-bisphosphoglycerate-dependent phosphoglycerate mutase
LTTICPTTMPAQPTSTQNPLAAGEVVLVRHGQGECNAAGTIGGQLGCRGLSERGRWESDRLAERLAKMDADGRFDALLCSPRLRVLESAQIIGTRLTSPVTVVEELAGQEFGAADGQPWEQVTGRFGGTPAHDPGRPIAAGAESWNSYADRVLAALAGILAQHAGQRVLLVAHGKTSGLAGALLSGAPDPRASVSEFIIDHGTLSQWRRHSSDHWNLLVHNDSRHLSEA